jgi:dipeptidyl aminopeptidase/acylaminoacyl peptidase
VSLSKRLLDHGDASCSVDLVQRFLDIDGDPQPSLRGGRTGILHPAELDGRAVEFFLRRPDGAAAHPAILFVHGHQEPQRPGGRGYADVGRLDRMARAGFVAAAVSQPGYGGSDGPPDYCGPRTQLAIRAVLGYLRSLDTVNGENMALYGVSRGATASAMVATREPQLRALILVAGTYDLGAAYPTGNIGLDANIASEAGTTEEAFDARSALRHVSGIRARTLILHGLRDERAPVRQAEQLADLLSRQCCSTRLKLYETGHMIPILQQWRTIKPFLAQATRT